MFRFEIQRASGECGIACLATLTGKSYEYVLVEASREKKAVGKRPHENGLFLSNIVRIAGSRIFTSEHRAPATIIETAAPKRPFWG
jgi:hypothetical protein